MRFVTLWNFNTSHLLDQFMLLSEPSAIAIGVRNSANYANKLITLLRGSSSS